MLARGARVGLGGCTERMYASNEHDIDLASGFWM